MVSPASPRFPVRWKKKKKSVAHSKPLKPAVERDGDDGHPSASGVPDLVAPVDQRPDDSLSLCFDSPPLAENLPILGAPVVDLLVAADRPNALVSVRL